MLHDGKNKIGSVITTKLYHSLKLGSKKLDGTIINHIKDSKTRLAYNSKFEYVNNDQLKTFIKLGCEKYITNILQKKQIPNFTKFDFICAPQSKSTHVNHILTTLKNKLQANNLCDRRNTVIKIYKKSCKQMFGEYLGKLNILRDAISKTHTFITNPTSNDDIKNDSVHILTTIKNNVSSTSFIDQLHKFAENIISKKIYNKSTLNTILTHLSNATPLDNGIQKCILTLIVAWLYNLFTKQNFISSAADIRNTCNIITQSRIIKSNTTDDVENDINSDSYDIYSQNYYKPLKIHSTYLTNNKSEINILCCDDNVNWGSTIYEISRMLRNQFTSKEHNQLIINIHWFVLLMPVNDFKNVWQYYSVDGITNINKTIYGIRNTTYIRSDANKFSNTAFETLTNIFKKYNYTPNISFNLFEENVSNNYIDYIKCHEIYNDKDYKTFLQKVENYNLKFKDSIQQIINNIKEGNDEYLKQEQNIENYLKTLQYVADDDYYEKNIMSSAISKLTRLLIHNSILPHIKFKNNEFIVESLFLNSTAEQLNNASNCIDNIIKQVDKIINNYKDVKDDTIIYANKTYTICDFWSIIKPDLTTLKTNILNYINSKNKIKKQVEIKKSTIVGDVKNYYAKIIKFFKDSNLAAANVQMNLLINYMKNRVKFDDILQYKYDGKTDTYVILRNLFNWCKNCKSGVEFELWKYNTICQIIQNKKSK